jgi:hypothetical protein
MKAVPTRKHHGPQHYTYQLLVKPIKALSVLRNSIRHDGGGGYITTDDQSVSMSWYRAHTYISVGMGSNPTSNTNRQGIVTLDGSGLVNEFIALSPIRGYNYIRFIISHPSEYTEHTLKSSQPVVSPLFW